jgi:hypothetical protein
MLLLNTHPTISRSQLLIEQLCGVIRDHETFLSTLHPRGLAYTAELLAAGQRFLDAIEDADREQAEADGATGAYTAAIQDALSYVKALRLEVRAVGDQIKREDDEIGARALVADYMIRQTRLSIERPGDVRSLIEQFAKANAKHRALLTSWGIDAARLDQAKVLAAGIPDAIHARRTETTEAEQAVTTRNTAQKNLIDAINPLLRRLNTYTGAQTDAVTAFESVINKFRADLTDPSDAQD